MSEQTKGEEEEERRGKSSNQKDVGASDRIQALFPVSERGDFTNPALANPCWKLRAGSAVCANPRICEWKWNQTGNRRQMKSAMLWEVPSAVNKRLSRNVHHCDSFQVSLTIAAQL